jgi:hypothetical protein
MDAKLHMEKFLNDYTDHLDAINFVQNTAVMRWSIQYVVPRFFEEALSREWEQSDQLSTVMTILRVAEKLSVRVSRHADCD